MDVYSSWRRPPELRLSLEKSPETNETLPKSSGGKNRLKLSCTSRDAIKYPISSSGVARRQKAATFHAADDPFERK